MAKLRDKFWVWGHPEGRYNFEFGNNASSRMTPMEGALYMGARNMFMVPVGVDLSWRQYNKSFVTLDNVGWCLDNTGAGPNQPINPQLIDKLIEEARDFPNITCGVFDDFNNYLNAHKDTKPDMFHEFHERMHNNKVRPLDMWMVLYTQEFGLDEQRDRDFQPYVDAFDGVIMWTWKASDLRLFEEKYAKFKEMTKNKRRMLGLYLYNFGEHRKATGKATLWQLERYTELLKAGEIEGIVLHTNTMADLDHEAYDVERAWMQLHGDEEI